MAFVPIRTIVGTDEEDTGFKPLRDVYLGPAPQRGAIAAGLSAGVDQLQGLGYSALGGVADIAGASGVSDWANEQARRNQIDASVGGRPDLERIEDQTLGSALPYVGYQIAKQVPTMAGIAGAQFIPGFGQAATALGLTRLGAVAPRMLGGGGLQAGSSAAARRAALAQGEAFGTGTLAGSAMGFGSLYGESVEGGDPSPFKALALAPIYGAAEAVLPAVLQGSLRAPARYSGNLGTRMAKAGGVAGAGESLTELGQNELEMGMRSDLTAEEMASRRLNAAAAGLIVGGSLGTVGGLRGPMDLTKPDTEQETQTSTEQKPILGLQYNPLAGTPIIFPDGTVALGSEQEMLARTGIKLPAAAAEKDLTAPAGTTTAAAGVTKPTTPSIFSETDTALNKLGVKPTKNSRGIYDYLVAEGIDPASPEAEPVMNALAASKVGEARKAVGEIIRARSTRGTGISTVQQPAGGLGVGSPVVQGTVGDAGRVAPVAGTVVGGAPAAGAPLQQTGLLPITAGQPSTPVTTGALSGPQASQTIETAPQGQTTTTVSTAAPVSQPLAPGQFRRAPKPMTVLQAARATPTPSTAAEPVVDERREILQKIFGERNGGIIFDVVGMGMPEPEAAAKYGLSRQSIQKIAGATGQKEWPALIAGAKAKFNLTDAQIADAFNTVAPDSTEGQIASEVFTQDQASMDENEAIEAGLGNIVKTAGAGTSEVEGFTKLQKEIDATLEALAVETDPAVLADLNAKLTAQIEKVKAVEKQAQAEVRALAGRKSDKDASDEKEAKADQPKELGAEDAVQVESTTSVSVQPKAETSKAVVGQVRRVKKPATESKAQVPAVILTQAEQAAQAWDVVAANFPGAPKFADLTKAQQNTFIGFGEGNWERGDVELELTKLARTAASTQRAIGREPVTIDVESRIIDETVAPQVAKLPAPQVTRLENHYNAKRDSAEFLAKVKADVVLYATKGAEAVAGAIRDIIKSIHAGVLSAAMIFNPTAISQVEAFVVIPQETQTTTTQVLAELPAEVKGMSEAGKQAYATLIPALKGKIGDKFVTIADKPSGRIFVFKANGELVLQQKALFGLAKGDLYKGNNDLKQNRVTPAGLFGINVVDAAKGGDAAKTAGDYDFGKVFALDDPDATVTFMHSVWLKESDAAKRAAALKNDSAADSRYSFGCINVDKETFKDMVGKYSNQMDGSKLFVVPDVQSTVNDFITGNVANDRLVREGVQPVTKTTTTPVKSATKTAGVDRTVAAKDEEVGGMKFGKEGAPVKQPYTAKELLAELKDFIRADIPGRKLMVVDSVVDLLTSTDEKIRAVGAALQLEGAYGVAVDGRAYLIANRIKQGSGRAKFMHEVGGHLGLDNLLTKADQDKLVNQIKTWAKKADGSLEAELALQAFERVQAAQTPQEDRRSELIAYFIESAMEMGVDPTAANDTKLSGPLREWFRNLWAAFKVAARKLGLKPESMTAQDVVNLAYGAARLEINGTWHGTAASFRNFRHKFMGTGEGAQAFGWGTYLAQRTGIAKAYWTADVERKASGQPRQLADYPGKDAFEAAAAANDYLGLGRMGNLISSAKRGGMDLMRSQYDISAALDKELTAFMNWVRPEGNLMRVDTAVPENEMLDWDKVLSRQTSVLNKIKAKLPEDLREAVEEEVNETLEGMTGEDFYRALMFVEDRDGFVSEQFDVADYNKRLANAPTKQVVSAFIDEKLGVNGLKFLDSASRGNPELLKAKLKQKQELLAEKQKDLDKASKEADRWEGLYDDAPADQKTYARKTWLNAVSARTSKEFEVEQLKQDIVQDTNKLRSIEKKTRNLVIFNDKNIFRVGSEAAADRQRMKFGSDMVELGKRGQLKEKAGKTRVDTANDRAIKLLEKAAKTKDPAEAEALRAEANALFSATAGKLSGMKFGKNAVPQGLIDRNIAKLPNMSQQPVKRVVESIGDLGGKYLDYALFTNDLVKRAQALGLGAAKTFFDRLAARNAKVSEEERKIEKIADRYALIEDVNKGSGPGSVNEFLFESTRTGKWGYDTAKFKADPAMKAEFDKLGPKAQQFVKDVFAHGDATLSNKKTIVLNATNSEYDAMIKAAQDLVNTATDSKVKTDAEKELAKLKAEKAATLKRFQTLFRIREGIPYSPIKRTGAYVVIGESAEYKAAKANKDTATVKKLESDPDHYHVSFVDTKWQARNLKDNLAEQGVFDSPQIVKRSESFDEAFSGEAMLPALTKMRAAVDRRAQDANGKKDPTAGKLLNIINQLYLEALAEGSARKSEMRRRGVSGEVDMLQSFTQQGRADANFLASVEFEPKIQDALQQMRNQSRTGDRERKSEIFDELTQRYADSLEPKNNPFINGLTNMASKFFLASSPGYYLQNLTQPFMMSLPAMAGRHDYTKAAAALAKAYTELGPLFKDVKLFDQQFDFSKVPADVRTAINDLVNQGKIDIGLATEINEYKVEADGKLSQFAQRLNKGMRMAVQKVEATNRLSTAIAAYRLEFERAKKDPKIADPKAAATQYAADILTETHGDYTAFNAPRAFNTQWGKVALQFRKFQLIQIAFYTKLIRDAFTNPDERAVAMKTLGYSLGHTAVFAGMMGLPGYAAIAAIMSAFGDEDEPYDLTAEMRKALGPEWADMIMRGAPTLVGMDLSGKIGAGNMLSIMPFSDADLSTNAGRAEAFGTLMGGAALGMASRVVDGLGLIASGDYYKGIERTMPKGVSDALKAGRQAAEGMTRRNGDVILPDSEISAIDTVMTGLGVPAVKQAVTYERQNRMRDITENFQDRTTRIKNDYTKAVREQDTEAMAEARAAWTKLQQTRQRNGLTPQPVSSLLKAPQEQRAREQRTVGGVQYREGQRKLAESVVEN